MTALDCQLYWWQVDLAYGCEPSLIKDWFELAQIEYMTEVEGPWPTLNP